MPEAPTDHDTKPPLDLREATAFNPSAETYEDGLVPAIFEPWGRRLVEHATPRTGDRVLDLACGTGIVARIAAGRVGPGGTVAGFDINPEMLAVAGSRADQAGVRIDWRQGNAAGPLPFDDDAFDIVLCQQGLQFFTDREVTLKEVRRLTAPRGRAVFSIWRGLEHHPALDTFDRALGRHLPPTAMEGSTAPFSFDDPDELRRLVGAEFGGVHLRYEVGAVRFGSVEQMLHAIGGAFAPVGAAVAELDDTARTALLADLRSSMHGSTDDDGVTYPMVAAVVLAHP